MWDIIARVATERRVCSVILTTHSMEECEALCNRIGIMVDGRLQVCGCVCVCVYLRVRVCVCVYVLVRACHV